MRKPALLVLIFILATACIAAPQKKKIGTVELYGWGSLQMMGDTVVVSGGAPELKTTDGRFYAKANKMVVTFNKAPKGKKLATGRDAIKNAELTGNVIFSARPDDGRYIKGSGAKLTIIGADQEAILEGAGKQVQVEAMDPQVFEKPANLTGDKVRVNLKPNLAPDEWRIKVESSPEKSHISVTPKPRSETK